MSQQSTLSGYAHKLRPECANTLKSEPSQESAPKTSLPRIKLQMFSDAYGDWPAFRDLFQSIIGSNVSISEMEKLHYLRSCFQDPAEQLIRSLTIVGDNYSRAWAIFTKHYENKWELIRANFAAFTAVPRMKTDSADESNI